MNYLEELTKLEKKIESQKIEKAKLEERLSNIEKQQLSQEKELKEINITRSDIGTTIDNLESEIKEEIEKCQSLL